ncbi:uncharacterized protein MKZ38_003534 [Zalerion maritima]|uniref:Fluoride export protein 1 n=1 Tax=Zalerion maritima TaxID=339359 RepID=A0AAD5RMM4_9PEZI|nr:uncharacterized protein MKZ38_003534 [Zalerion maritima]
MTQHTSTTSPTYTSHSSDRHGQQHHDSIASTSPEKVGEDISQVPTTTSSTSPHSALHRTSTSRSARIERNERRASQQRTSTEYDIPASYQNLDDVYGKPPVQNPDEESLRRVASREDSFQDGQRPHSAETAKCADGKRQERLARRRSSTKRVDYDLPDVYANLDEIAATSPVQNPDEDSIYQHESLEQQRSLERIYTNDRETQRNQRQRSGGQADGTTTDLEKRPDTTETVKVSRLATQIYTVSYLVLFSIFGTLARLGLQALTTYQGAPLIFSSAWPNFAGTLLMGFLSEDRMLFRYEWGTPTYEQQIKKTEELRRGEGSGSSTPQEIIDLAAAKKAHMATKKTIPLYIGLATGFCGSFTSFSSFIRDIFLALVNEMVAPDVDSPNPRNGGYSFMALLAVFLITMTLSLSALFIGAHLAIALEPLTPSLPFSAMRKIFDPLTVFLALGCWVGAIVLSTLPPDRLSTTTETEAWRGRATVAICLAPLGCLGRFYLSLFLNGKSPSFPVGTFAANIAGTAVLGAAWDLQHAPVGGIAGCQVWQGIMDGFCGCLTTVSTFVAELTGLRRQHAYVYGGTSILSALAVLIAVMGGLKWSVGVVAPVCVT